MDSAEFKEKRLKLGLSQEKLAEIIGISKRQIINIEHSLNKVKPAYAKQLNNLLHQDFTMSSNANLPKEIMELISDYEELSEEEKEAYRLKIKRDAINAKLKKKGIDD